MKYPFALSDECDVGKALERLDSMYKSELGAAEGPVRNLHNCTVSLTGFMGSNPNAQIAYAAQNGFYPDTGQWPYEDE